MTTANEEQAEFWSEMAPTWAALDDRLEEVGGPPGLRAMDRLGLAPGQTVLDIGCGTGGTTVELARRVTPGGRVVGMDIAAGMLDAARARAERLEVSGTEFVVADVQVYDLGSAVYDAAFSRFGVMFFADPVAAFANVRSALKPGGTLAFACWRGLFNNEWMLVPGAAAIEAAGAAPQFPEPGQPGPFSLEDPEHVEAVLRDAGFAEVHIEPLDDHVVAEADRIPEIAAGAIRIGVVREVLRDADEQTRRQVGTAVEDALRARVVDGELRLTRGVLIVAARNT